MKREEVGGKFHNQTSTPPLVDGYCWCVFFFAFYILLNGWKGVKNNSAESIFLKKHMC